MKNHKKIVGSFLKALALLLILQSCGDDPKRKCGCEIVSDSLVTGQAKAYLNPVDNSYYLDEYTHQFFVCNKEPLMTMDLDINSHMIYSGYVGNSCNNIDTVRVITLISIGPAHGCMSPPIKQFEGVQGVLRRNSLSYIPYDYVIKAHTTDVWYEWVLFVCNNSALLDINVPEYPESIKVEVTGDIKYIESPYYDFGSYEHRVITIENIEVVE